ncbi:Chaperone protein DnaK [Rubripirellula obstinata]|uniref:Chaperone protein DnaK n=1 Tax=Rubripirellula obstinata TaxID=406547 RepID=A0A5B1CIF1_9BACT|nr:hsp70 family protein [Rubripirellula obstinata]KAA1260031.1 Chaperone protein DnaK [Rubripirellula obstinata]
MSRNSDSVEENQLSQSRYVIGIDLGTTNCAMAFVDTESENPLVETFSIEQWVDFGQRESRETLPSFHYELTQDEAASDHRLPWQNEQTEFCVGVLARDAGLRHPGRRAASAKSWLSHEGVDRTANLLPWHGDADVTRLSPVDVSSRYLKHLRQAWDHDHPDHPLADQDVVITLPASFDEVARELTIAAAKQAGLPRVYLIEEPQAAFYAWIDRQGQDWEQSVKPGQLILVCDIGGGTTDLTLIRVRSAGEAGQQLQFHRVAVGNHLILGGDNLDLAVAKLAESKIAESKLADESNQTLSPLQWDRLVQASRTVKEVMLSENRPDQYTINLPAEGSRLIGGGIQVQLTADEVDQVLLDGFFPAVELTDQAVAGESGFQEFGLPYAADAAITRHLAEFLSTHRRTGLDDQDEDAADRPDLVLFNGGVMSSPQVQHRIRDLLAKWFCGDENQGDKNQGDTDWQPQLLHSPRLDLAVARGAAYYAGVRRGEGVRIAANLGRSYYMQVSDNPAQGLCLIPGTAEAGQRFRAEGHPLQLSLGTPVQFPLWVSSTRLADSVGQLIEIDRSEASPLPPICTAIVEGKRKQNQSIRVVIESELSEIGTVGLHCVDLDSPKRWRLDFDIRSTLETDRDAHDATGEAAGIVDSETVGMCEDAIESVFAEEANSTEAKPSKLVKQLQSVTEMNRHRWPPSLLREQWQCLLDQREGRRKSAQHEARWLNLLGFCLRPGYGVAVDDWRVDQTWRSVYGKLAFPAAASGTEAMILWRRIAGGLTSGQQSQLAAPWISALKNKHKRIAAHEAQEVWRLLGSLERLPIQDKIDLGQAALNALSQRKNEKLRDSLLWSLGRIGSRKPVYGPINATVPTKEVSQWIDSIASLEKKFNLGDNQSMLTLAMVQLAQRTGDRFRDVAESQLDRVVSLLSDRDAADHLIELVKNGGSLHAEEEAAIFGDSLPLGIHLIR